MSSLHEDLKRAFEDKKRIDVTFLVGYNSDHVEKIQANKYILAVRSSVFDAQFSNPWNQTNRTNRIAKKRKICSIDNETEKASDHEIEGQDKIVEDYSEEVIEIPDASLAAFHSFLKYLYTDELEIPVLANTVGLIYLAVKYDIPRLVESSLKFLKENITTCNVFDVVEEAMNTLYVNLDDNIKDICLKHISINVKELIWSDEFTSVSINVLKVVVKTNNLGIEEAQLFKGIYNWALAECQRQSIENTNENIRRVIGDEVLYNIRFLQISNSKMAKDLASIIWGPTGILRNEEQLSLLTYEKLGVGPVVNFNTSPRRVRRFCFADRTKAKLNQNWPMWEKNNCMNYFCFCISHPADLEGFGFFGSMSQTNGEYNIHVRVRNKGFSTTYVSFDTKIFFDKPGDIIKVELDPPLSILEGMWYTIGYTIKGPSTYSGDGKLIEKVVVKDFLPNEEDFIIAFEDSTSFNSIYQLPTIYFGR